MDHHLPALLIKTGLITATLVVLFTLFNEFPFVNTVVLSLLTVGVSYVVGDLFILPMTNNMIATLADIGLCTFKLWFIGSFVLGAFVPFTLALLAAIIIGVGEYFFHQYMKSQVLQENTAS
ncbi:DUF2512 family protein [Caldalkalibacillus salinus]|uniref:DUF2512 family protein n=1 Tax=Caldalkalibacillus salinus TaxID=2803787 RepID=UPI001920B319|nr:DUF2512 family protein [Caldalkalibacillus salinus]